MPNKEKSELELIEVKTSAEGATKYLFRLSDGNLIESVILEHENMICACISCQVGCSLDCVFCATAKLGFIRNLSCEEIISQVVHLSNELGIERHDFHFGRILFMGMGEPLLNYDSVTQSAAVINCAQSLGVPDVFLATSVASLDNIRRLARDSPFIKLWISLCATDDDTRARLMPATTRVPIKVLLDAAEYYAETVGFPVRLNYLMIDGVNDSFACAEKLIHLLKNKHLTLQLSRLNPRGQQGLRGSPKKRMHKFAEYCISRGISTIMFESKGARIAAGCGQLAGRRFL